MDPDGRVRPSGLYVPELTVVHRELIPCDAEHRCAVYPGSFNPPTTAHLAIADSVRRQRDVEHVTLVLSRQALAKEHVARPLLAHRVAVIEALSARVPWLDVAVTDLQLLVDISAGFDVLVMGADKWQQINDPKWYGNDPRLRDRALSRLPELAIAPRPPLEVPTRHLIDIDPEHADTSSTAARSGRLSLMTPEAQHFALETGAWIDPARYDDWISRHSAPTDPVPRWR